MASVVNKISQIVRLKQVMQRWKFMSLTRRSSVSYPDDESDSSASNSSLVLSASNSSKRVPVGTVGVYVGVERRRFVIPTRFLNLPVFVALLNMYAEEFGFHSSGGLVFPCEIVFFKGVLKLLERDEKRYGRLGFDDFMAMYSEIGFDCCKDSTNACHAVTPLLQKTRV